MSGLRQVIYISRATGELSHEEIRELVAQAAANNRKNQITGALLYLEGSFIQVLEGDRGAIEALLEKLRRDSRHCDLRLLSDIEIPDRRFENWSMGLVETPESDRLSVMREMSSVSTGAESANSDEFDQPMPETVMMMQRLYETDSALQRARADN